MKYNPIVLAIYAVGFLVAWMKTPGISEHDRFADRAIYSDDPALDPLATRTGL